MQINHKGTLKQKKEFIHEFLKLSSPEFIKCQILDCSISWTRQAIDLETKDIIDMMSDDSLVTIKIVDNPLFKLREYEKWPDGYIDLCVHTMSNPNYFIWSYIEMKHKNFILELINNQ